MLGFDRDVFRIELTFGDEIGEVLNDMGLGRNGIGSYHVHVAMHGGFGDSDGDFHSCSLGHYSTSSSMTMQPVQHSVTQMPQPLQNSISA